MQSVTHRWRPAQAGGPTSLGTLLSLRVHTHHHPYRSSCLENNTRDNGFSQFSTQLSKPEVYGPNYLQIRSLESVLLYTISLFQLKELTALIKIIKNLTHLLDQSAPPRQPCVVQHTPDLQVREPPSWLERTST